MSDSARGGVPSTNMLDESVHRLSAVPQTGSAPVLRVLILSPDPAQQGGVVNNLQLLARRLDARFVSDIFPVGRRHGESGVLRMIARVIADLLHFASTIARGQYDVVHLNPSLNGPSILREAAFLIVLKFMRFRSTLIFFRGWDVTFERRIAGNVIYRRAFARLFGTAGEVLVLSTRFEMALRAFGFCCPIAVVTTMFDGQDLRRALDERHPRSSILYLSRFVREKGVYELIHAFAMLSASYPTLTLVMAGDGPEASGLRETVRKLGIEDRVQFPGYLSGLEKARALVQAQVFVLPTTYPEGLPNALLEALAAGNVVITTRVGGIAEIVSDPDNGVLLDSTTADEIRAALERVLKDEAYCEMVSARNMTAAWSRYEAHGVTRRIEAIYKRLASRIPAETVAPSEAL